MTAFADTSGLFALLVRNDRMHDRARLIFERFSQDHTQLASSSYVVIETVTLLQRRVSLEAVWEFNVKILPVLDVIRVDEFWHGRAMQRLQIERSRDLSLTDCLSFEIMEAREITTAFTFDRHFADRGFNTA